MDKEMHGEIIREIAQYFKITNQVINKLIKYTKKPDEEAIENIKKYKQPSAKNIWGEISNALRGMGNAIIELMGWAYTHSAGAPEQFLYHFNIAFEILIIEKPKSKKRKDIGFENLAYCLHYVIDVGTPYHSKSIRDILDIEEFHQMQQKLSEKELNKYSKGKFFELFLFFANHHRFEDDLKRYWDITDLQIEYKKEIAKAVEKIKISPKFSSHIETGEWFKDFILKLKKGASDYFNFIQQAYITEDIKKQKSEKILEVNKDVFKYSKKCIYNIALITAMVLGVFFDKKTH